MTEDDFLNKIRAQLADKTFENPGGGSTIIEKITDQNVIYKRGKSSIKVQLQDLYEAYSYFKNQNCSSTKLKDYKPQVFDSKKGGHSCNCTFFFLVLKEIECIDYIYGSGKKGDPFYINL